MRKLLTYTCLLFFCVTALAFGQGLPMAVPEEVGVSAERLERIRPMLQDYVDAEHLPGFLTVVARRGKIVHFETIGMRDVENEKPIEPDTILRIYSMSKPITSIAVMILYEEGHFQLNTPVSKFMPEFENMKVYNEDQTEILDAKKEITIKHLLMHTAGFTYGWGDKPVDERYKELKIFENGSTLADMVKKLGDIPLVHEPDERWTYGVSTDVLGYLVEVVSGMPFEASSKLASLDPLAWWTPHFRSHQRSGTGLQHCIVLLKAVDSNVLERKPTQTVNSLFSLPAVEGSSQPPQIICGFLRCCSTMVNSMVYGCSEEKLSNSLR